jgi:hypothetical protein
MADLTKVLEAIAALAATIPGVDSDGRTNINIHGCSDATIRVLADLGATVETNSNGRTEQWESAEIRVGNVTVCAFGPHRPWSPVALDAQKVNAALAQAQAALS